MRDGIRRSGKGNTYEPTSVYTMLTVTMQPLTNRDKTNDIYHGNNTGKAKRDI